MPDKIQKLKRLLTLAEDPLGATFDEIEKLDERVTELETLPQLKGEPGTPAEKPVKGVDYFDGKDGRTPVFLGSKLPDNPQKGDLWYQD